MLYTSLIPLKTLPEVIYDLVGKKLTQYRTTDECY